MRRTRVLVALLPVALALSACGGAKHAGSGGSPVSPSTAASSGVATPPAAAAAADARPATGQLTDLHSVAQLNSLFDAGAGEPRLVVLMSPT